MGTRLRRGWGRDFEGPGEAGRGGGLRVNVVEFLRLDILPPPTNARQQLAMPPGTPPGPEESQEAAVLTANARKSPRTGAGLASWFGGRSRFRQAVPFRRSETGDSPLRLGKVRSQTAPLSPEEKSKFSQLCVSTTFENMFLTLSTLHFWN
jgi:hypothetical protein